MMSIFSDMIEEIMEIFMDDFSVYGKTFDQCLAIWIESCKDAKKKTWYSTGRSSISWSEKASF